MPFAGAVGTQLLYSEVKVIRSGDVEQLHRGMVALGPWHQEVQITPELSTAAWLQTFPEEEGPGHLLDAREGWQQTLGRLFPEGLEGRSVFDCACNCGGYLFWSKEMGAGRCFGFDVREHWIKQARFLLENRVWPAEDLRFEVRDLYDVPALGLAPFDICVFKGIFYHLPDPIRGLKIAADLTKQLLVLNTAMRADLPDGLLALEQEEVEPFKSGVYGLGWFPTGPGVLADILRWAGFVDTVVTRQGPGTRIVNGRPMARVEVLASKEHGLLDPLRA
jgi:tRNA (mo5U34)-methyltransferase